MKNFFTFVLWSLIATQSLAEGSVVVIANRKVPVEKIDASQATQYFLKQDTRWPDGTQVQPVDLREDSALRKDFYLKVTGRSRGQLRAFWARQAFTGQGFPPKELATTEEVLRFIEATPGAIGYVDRKTAEGSVKILLDSNN